MPQNKIFESQLNSLLAETSLDFATVPANGVISAPLTAIVSGAAVDDYVQVISKNASTLAQGLSFWGYVPAPDTVLVYAYNTAAGAFDPPGQTFLIKVIKKA